MQIKSLTNSMIVSNTKQIHYLINTLELWKQLKWETKTKTITSLEEEPHLIPTIHLW